MPKQTQKINQSLEKQITDMFAQVIADFRRKSNVEVFIRDFFTDAEIMTFSKRLAVAYWLKKGRSYTNIKENIKVSSATIASVQEMLDKKGVKEAIRHIEAEEWANVWTEKIKKLRKSSPLGIISNLMK